MCSRRHNFMATLFFSFFFSDGLLGWLTVNPRCLTLDTRKLEGLGIYKSIQVSYLSNLSQVFFQCQTSVLSTNPVLSRWLTTSNFSTLRVKRRPYKMIKALVSFILSYYLCYSMLFLSHLRLETCQPLCWWWERGAQFSIVLLVTFLLFRVRFN
jgi:hypothetical protein